MKLLAVPIPIFERFNPYCFGFAVELRVANAKSVANLLFQSLLFWICRRTYPVPFKYPNIRIVSILIVLDLPQNYWEWFTAYMTTFCFNPYCFGFAVELQNFLHLNLMQYLCFNPYCFGFAVELRSNCNNHFPTILFQSLLFWICRRTGVSEIPTPYLLTVSILIVLDLPQNSICYLLFTIYYLCFNPYCFGFAVELFQSQWLSFYMECFNPYCFGFAVELI